MSPGHGSAEGVPRDPGPRGIPVPGASADAPPLPGTPAAPALRPPPPPVHEDEDDDHADDATRTDERALPADPFPPPFRWSTEGTDGHTSPDTTQVVRDAAGPAADRTQVVPRGGPEPEATQVVRRSSVPPRGAPPRAAPPASERTQFVPGSVPARSAGGGVARPEETAPPWAAGAARSEGLPGRELFARGPGPRAGAILGTAAVVLLVLVVLVASIALA